MTAAILASLLLAFGRSAGFMFSAPLIGDRGTSVQVRLIASLAFASVIALSRGPVDPATAAMALPMEIAIGALTGFAARLALAAAEAGGQLLGLPFALGFANTFDPQMGESAIVTRRLALVLASMAFLALDGLNAGVRLMLLAPMSEASVLAGISVLIDWSHNVLGVAARISAAAIVAGLVANIGIAMAARAAPSLNIFSVMLAAMLTVGGLVLIATSATFARQLTDVAREAVNLMGRVAGA